MLSVLAGLAHKLERQVLCDMLMVAVQSKQVRGSQREQQSWSRYVFRLILHHQSVHWHHLGQLLGFVS